jgi:RNA polymerase sigma factor (sigma-70 family)
LSDLRELLLRANRHDDDAARELVQRLYPTVVKIVRAMQYEKSWEDDLVQEIFLKVFSRGGQYRGGVPLEHWVSRLAVSSCLDHRRARRRRPELRWADLGTEEAQYLAAELAAPQGITPADNMAAGELVERLLSCLPAHDALLMRLMYIEELSVTEVHQLTGWNRAVIKIRAFRARRKLRKVLATLEEEYDHAKHK